MARIKIGFIGCGAVAELHNQGLKACSKAELAGIYDSNPGLLRKRSKEWNVRGYESLQDLLEDREIQAVFVLTPVDSHYADVLAALNAGKHVLVEKPIANELHEIIGMADLARSKGLQCMPAHNYIYSPDMYRLKKNLREGNFGKIPVSWILYHIHHSEELCARYPGILRQIGFHLLYTHRYLFGDPASISTHTTRFLYPHLDRDDQAMLTLTMPDGSISNLFASFAVTDHSSSPWSFIIKVLGTQGSVQLSWQDVVLDRAIGTLSRSYGRYEETYEHEIQYFINECILEGKPPLSTLMDAYKVLELILRAEEDSRKK
ncbi:MAG TPA: Gfo/Idh/MocA family oxidoreductase [Puia sp.]|nr:Gfo/Idh/MocA family oxidoreductase [Puia sp.]